MELGDLTHTQGVPTVGPYAVGGDAYVAPGGRGGRGGRGR
jgi:hypothetical protein